MMQLEHRDPQPVSRGILALWLLAAGSAHAAQPPATKTPPAPAPTAAIMAPVNGIVSFMTQLPQGVHPDVFVGKGLTIVENFPPYLFRGASAAADWEQGFRKHATDDDYTELAVTFGPARDFGVTGDRAYFCLPTTWTGRTHGRPFEEHGAWAFIVQKESRGWRILAYGWGETAHADPAP